MSPGEIRRFLQQFEQEVTAVFVEVAQIFGRSRPSLLQSDIVRPNSKDVGLFVQAPETTYGPFAESVGFPLLLTGIWKPKEN